MTAERLATPPATRWAGTHHPGRTVDGAIAWVERHAVAWEVVMSVVSAVYFLLAVLADSGLLWPRPWLLTIAALLLAEFTVRCAAAHDRLAYLKHHWIDGLAIIPLIGGIRILTLLLLAHPDGRTRVANRIHRVREGDRSGFWFLLPSALLLWVGAAAAFWFFEHGVNPHAASFGTCLYWAFFTATTVGYGDVTPRTPGGQVVAGVLVLFGIGLIGAASSRLTAIWLHSRDEVADLRTEVCRQHAEVMALLAELQRDRAAAAQEGIALPPPTAQERAAEHDALVSSLR